MRELTLKERQEWYAVFAAPREWLDEAYKGLRDVSAEGWALFVDSKMVEFIAATVGVSPLGWSWIQILAPEVRINPESEVKLVTKMGGFIMFKGRGQEVEVLDNPEDKIKEKARASLARLGVPSPGEEDEF